jgi:hypothetical protein
MLWEGVVEGRRIDSLSSVFLRIFGPKGDGQKIPLVIFDS